MKLSKTAQFIIVLSAFLVLGISFKVMVLEGVSAYRGIQGYIADAVTKSILLL